MNLTIEDLDVPARIRNYLAQHSGINTVEELLVLSRDELLRRPGIGTVSLGEIEAALAVRGLRLPQTTKVPPPSRMLTEAERIDPIKALGLSARATYWLGASGITRVGDLLDMTLAELLRHRGVGLVMADEVRTALRRRGLALKVYERRAPPIPVLGDPTMPVEVLYHAHRVGFRSVQRLEEIGVRSIGDLAGHTASDLLALRGIGPAVLAGIREELAALGFSLAKEGE